MPSPNQAYLTALNLAALLANILALLGVLEVIATLSGPGRLGFTASPDPSASVSP